jgi:hypothetical protein
MKLSHRVGVLVSVTRLTNGQKARVGCESVFAFLLKFEAVGRSSLTMAIAEMTQD